MPTNMELEQLVEKLTAQVGALQTEVQNQRDTALRLPTVAGGARPAQVEEVYDGQERTVGAEKRRLAFRQGDIVKLRPDTDLAQRFMKYLETHPGAKNAELLKRIQTHGILGQVKSGFPSQETYRPDKFKVDFPGLGADGCREKELELVRRR